ncbi:ABC transporter ATP-binding protein [Aureimonas flava]|uniref:ABC transporter ATP-binding protein n=1 Tax=Aureimonas flava TaxID=2320271 RepID=A0A3A1WG30_9HYPH|nr:ABC transporter ATP-binding protein [Aureimonas flava]RIX98190.1 ABC transporter ATP-binding protein [Aureimonas flava]
MRTVTAQGVEDAIPYREETSKDARYLEVVAVRKSFRGATVMDGMNFRMRKGELVSLLGPSGCGKTTLLRIIAGLVVADEGDVVLGSRNITDLPAHKRNVSVVFQNYALFPHLSVAENVAFGLKARGRTRAEAEGPVRDALKLVRMETYADKPIAGLSGGQQQRIAVARALVVKPDLLLLDEPFSALDRKLRETMQVELKSLLRDSGTTAIFVTHDQEEALSVSDRIAVMNAGRIEQFASPSTLYARPETPFVMDFVGLSLRLHGRAARTGDDHVAVETAHGIVRTAARLEDGEPAIVGVRPELVRAYRASDVPREPSGRNRIEVTLEDVMILGSKTMLHGRSEGSERLVCELAGIQSQYVRGQRIVLDWAIEDTLAYGAAA